MELSVNYIQQQKRRIEDVKKSLAESKAKQKLYKEQLEQINAKLAKLNCSNIQEAKIKIKRFSNKIEVLSSTLEKRLRSIENEIERAE